MLNEFRESGKILLILSWLQYLGCALSACHKSLPIFFSSCFCMSQHQFASVRKEKLFFLIIKYPIPTGHVAPTLSG